jgi:serine/threonine-protein kinase RsbW
MKDSVRITVPSHPKYLGMVRDVTARVCSECRLDERETENVKLAVDEACANVIRHAYRGDAGREIVVQFTASPDQIEVVIEDDGITADPGAIKGRSLDEVRPGGLGVHFIRRTFDIVEFEAGETAGNRLRLVKYLKERHEDRDSGT